MNYQEICQKILETDELIELVKKANPEPVGFFKKYNLEKDLERLCAKREYYIQKLARL